MITISETAARKIRTLMAKQGLTASAVEDKAQPTA